MVGWVIRRGMGRGWERKGRGMHSISKGGRKGGEGA